MNITEEDVEQLENLFDKVYEEADRLIDEVNMYTHIEGYSCLRFIELSKTSLLYEGHIKDYDGRVEYYSHNLPTYLLYDEELKHLYITELKLAFEKKRKMEEDALEIQEAEIEAKEKRDLERLKAKYE